MSKLDPIDPSARSVPIGGLALVRSAEDDAALGLAARILAVSVAVRDLAAEAGGP